MRALLAIMILAGVGGSAVGAEPRNVAIVVYPGFKPGAVVVPPNAPPTFLVCADDDPSHVVTTVNLYLDLQKQGVPAEMHIYASGKHGFALRAASELVRCPSEKRRNSTA